MGSTFVDGGVFALAVACQPTDVESFASKLASSFKSLAGGVTSDEVARAKAVAKNALLSASSCKNDALNQIAEQVIAGGDVIGKSEQAAAIDNVSEGDVSRVTRQLLSSSLSVAGYGDLSYLPRYDQLVPLFK
jgi:predicted Zn-dependent peptidase